MKHPYHRRPRAGAAGPAARLLTRWLLPAVVVTLAGAQGARAACVRHSGFAERTINMDMGRVYIPEGLEVGGVIKRQVFPIEVRGKSELMFTCDSLGGTTHGVILQGSPVPGLDHVYSTSMAGVGIRLSRTISNTITVYYPHELSFGPGASGGLSAGSQFEVELIKTAAITGSGTLAAGIYTRYYGNGDPTKSAITTLLSGNGIAIVSPSCTVANRVITVDFGRVATRDFKGAGSPAAVERTFDIELHCRAGVGTQNHVYLRMDATPHPVGKGVLRLAPGSTAGGVGIQVLDGKGQPVRYGDEVKVVESQIDGIHKVPFTARYYQTADRVEAGVAQGTATFTLDYK